MRSRLSASRAILVTTAILLFSHFTATAKGFPKPKEDGFFIKTIVSKESAPIYEKMSVTPIENCWLANENLKAVYLYLSAENVGFSLVKMEGGKEKCFAPSANLKLVKDSIKYEAMPKSNFLNGQFEIGNKLFPIGESGLYFIAIDASTNWISYLPVNTWNMLGTAIPGGWEPSKLVELKPTFSDDKKSAVFSIDSLIVRPGVFKFRSTDGWKVTIDSISDNDCVTKGSKVSTSFGGEIDSFVLSGNNIVSKFNGIYKVELFWNNGQKGHAAFTKLKDLPIVDYTNYKMGFFGDSYLLPNGTRANWDFNWGEEKDTNLPEKNGTIYTWHFKNVTLFNNGEFKFRQGNDWKGLCIDFQDVRNWSGNAKGDFVNIDTYFHTKNSGEATYDFTITIDAATEEISLLVDKK